MDIQERLTGALADRYQIEGEIGSGGMATVYLAEDLKHDRKVAVKVLRSDLAAVMGPDRFLAEIRTTANLSHPHILPLFDSGEADGILFYVMPFVEGESLSQRLDREGQLSVEEAVRIAGHLADALDYAHRQGVVHRDIKPANILFQDDDPVVTDFGIALAVSAAGEGRLTETGLSLGTPYYMSPEQAAGDGIPTAASDVYSLGCVLYEMLTGDPPHTGSSAQAVLGKILLGEVTKPTKLRRTIPANVEAAILKAVERLPADRFDSAAALATALKDKSFRYGSEAETSPAGGHWNGLTLGFGAVALLALIALMTTPLWHRPSPLPVLEQEIRPLGAGATTLWAHYFALAPDGSGVVYRDTVGLSPGRRLWVKDRGDWEGRPLSGTTNGRYPVYSPDGKWVAYSDGSSLKKSPVGGGGAETILEGVATTSLALHWTAEDEILCEQRGNVLVRISASGGGVPDTLFVSNQEPLIWVQGLPEGDAALVVRCRGACGSGSFLSVLDLETGTARVLMDGVVKAWYVDTGHVVWVRRDGAVFATSFDLDRGEMSGDPVSLFGGVRTTTATAAMVLGLDGTVVFVQGRDADAEFELVWVDREGKEEAIQTDLRGGLNYPALSPDGTLLAVALVSGEGQEVWVTELGRGSDYPLTHQGGERPAWTPDGRYVLFRSAADGNFDLFTVRADGSGPPEPLWDDYASLADVVWSPDSTWLVTRTSVSTDGSGDILARRMDGDTATVRLVATDFREVTPALSPDGRFLAYVSDESGMNQVYVRPFPDTNEWKMTVSIGEGQEPVWARDGRELFYRKGPSGELVAVHMEIGNSLVIGGEEVLFPAGNYRANYQRPQYDVSPDGQRFVMLRPLDPGSEGPQASMVMIQNWFTRLRELTGG